MLVLATRNVGLGMFCASDNYRDASMLVLDKGISLSRKLRDFFFFFKETRSRSDARHPLLLQFLFVSDWGWLVQGFEIPGHFRLGLRFEL